MNSDETTWHCINQGFCSFKVKLKQPPQTFCRNQYNVTGLCNRVSCPLANSEYATVLEQEGLCYLYIKTVERAHTPKKMWEKIELSKNYMVALKQIDDNLLYWADHKKNRCKQRLTKLRQALLRERKQVLQPKLTEMVGIKKKTERREAVREAKAEKAAQVELAIERELLDRLKQGTYGDLYNLDRERFEQMLDKVQEADSEKDLDLDLEDEDGVRLMEMEDEDERAGKDERELDYVVGDLEGQEDEWGDSDESSLELSGEDGEEEDPNQAAKTDHGAESGGEDLSDEENPEDDPGKNVVVPVERSRNRSGGGGGGDMEDIMGGAALLAAAAAKKRTRKGEKGGDKTKPKKQKHASGDVRYEMEYEEEAPMRERLLA